MGLKESGLRGSIRNVSTGIGAAISIDTLEAENVEQDSATIRGEITELTNFGEDAEVFFEWGEDSEGLPNTTDIQEQGEVGIFTEDLTNLSEDTTHEFQAFGSVRDVSDDGVVLTFETGAAIPDSVVSRPDDNSTTDRDGDRETGLVIKTKSEWRSIGARISNNTSGANRAYLRDESDESLIESVDISSLSAGDSFTFDGVNLSSNQEYFITVDGDGSDYTLGFLAGDDTNFPYESDDVDIVDAIRGPDFERDNAAQAVNDIGNTGFE